MNTQAVINGETKIWSDSKGWIKPEYLSTQPNPEPKKVYRYVRLKDVAGELMEGVVETLESLKARIAWSRTAGPDQFRSLDLWLLERNHRGWIKPEGVN